MRTPAHDKHNGCTPEEHISPPHTVLVGLAHTVTAGLHEQILLGDRLTKTICKTV